MNCEAGLNPGLLQSAINLAPYLMVGLSVQQRQCYKSVSPVSGKATGLVLDAGVGFEPTTSRL